MEGAFINMKLIIGNRESGTGNWFLVPYLSKRVGYFKTVDREQGIGNQELVTYSLFGYILPMFKKCKSGMRNQFLVPFKLIGFILVSGFAYIISMQAFNDTKGLMLFVCIKRIL